jgi:hypothetical protein
LIDARCLRIPQAEDQWHRRCGDMSSQPFSLQAVWFRCEVLYTHFWCCFLVGTGCWGAISWRCREETGASLLKKKEREREREKGEKGKNNLNSVGNLVDHTYKCLSVLITHRPCWFKSRNVWVRTARGPLSRGSQDPFLFPYTLSGIHCL